MKVEQKSYAQIVIVAPQDFIFSQVWSQYEATCPFLCFPGMLAGDFRCSLKKPEEIVLNKDVILLLESYWNLLASEEKKAILDHELGHISSGHLKAIEEKIKQQGKNFAATVDENDEKEADAYSADINGSKAMHNGLMKALTVIVDGYKKKGYSINVSQALNGNTIIKNRLKVLEEKMEQ